MTRRNALRGAVAGALLTLVAAGCGAGAGSEQPTSVKLTITDGFGAKTLLEKPSPQVAEGDTVMRLLERNAKVEKRYGGGFVQSIDGVSGGREGNRPRDWFYFVNGILEDEGAASVDVRGGDRIWWDRHDWAAASNTPAVVGSFPEPFVSGMDGKKFSTRIECDEGIRDACDAVQEKFTDLGLVVGKSRPGTEGGFENLRVLVGRWPAIRGDRSLVRIEDGPKSSGVYATISKDGKTITALDARGEKAQELGPGTGLIAATRWREDAPTWVVTGTDDAGIRAAAAAFDESVLAEKFALAISPQGQAVPLPVPDDDGGTPAAG